jgi:CGNR zinc finger
LIAARSFLHVKDTANTGHEPADVWRRLKICCNDVCSVSFYDRSRNNSAVYHDSRVCGNAIYLRVTSAQTPGRAQRQPSLPAARKALTLKRLSAPFEPRC